MQTRQIGRDGPHVSAMGLGLMRMSFGQTPGTETESIATIHAALDAGINLFDTGDFYGMGHNEMLLARALEGRREDAFICGKFGALRAPDGQMTGFDGRPEAAKNFLSYTLQRLGTDYIDLYMPARLDPNVPIEETVGALADLVEAGYIRHIGLSEVSAATVRRAHAVHPIAGLQIEYGIMSRRHEQTILPTLRELGVATLAYGIVSHGLVDQPENLERFEAHGHPGMPIPRFEGENLRKNRDLVTGMASIAERAGMTVGQLAHAWLLAKGSDILPIMGTTRRARLAENLAAVDMPLADDLRAELEELLPPDAPAGDRYPPEHMHMLDSERPVAS